MEQPLDNIPHTTHARQNDAPLLFHIALPMALPGIIAAAAAAIPSPEPTIHPNPAARKRSLVGRGLQALARGDWKRAHQLTEQIQREGLSHV
jgi:hypothetical protein